jgi:hypothetical protein
MLETGFYITIAGQKYTHVLFRQLKYFSPMSMVYTYKIIEENINLMTIKFN